MKTKNIIFKKLAIVVITLTLCLATIPFLPTVSAETITVPGDYLTIQEAINAANAGDTILVDAGTYEENLIIDGKDITLLSTDGRDHTSIQPDTLQSNAIELRGTTTNVQIGAEDQGFTIIGAEPTNQAVETAAIYIKGTHSGIYIEGNEIMANGDSAVLGEWGASISDMVISKNMLSGKTFVGDTPAGQGTSEQWTLFNVPRSLVYIGGDNKNDITFTYNQVTGIAGGLNDEDEPQGNQIVIIDAASATITHNYFSGKTAWTAATLRARGTDTIIENNEFESGSLLNLHVFLGDDTVVGGAEHVLEQNDFDKSALVFENPVKVNIIFATIQAAINVAEDGDTVEVYPGTYAEQLLIQEVGKNNITLLGSADGDGVPTTIIDLTSFSSGHGVRIIDATGITIKNFEIHESPGRGIYATRADEILIENIRSHNNTVDGIRVRESIDATIESCISVDNSGDGITFYSYGSILNSTVGDNDERGIYIHGQSVGSGKTGSVTISGNTVYNNLNGPPICSSDHRVGGIIVYSAPHWPAVHYVIIKDNIVYDNVGPGILLYKVNSWHIDGLPSNPAAPVDPSYESIVKGNVIYGNKDRVTMGPGDGIFLYLSHYVTLEDNEIYDNENAGIRITNDYKYNVYGPTTNNTLLYNNIYNNEYSVLVKGNSNYKVDNTVIQFNNIYDNTYGLDNVNNADEIVDAICNWWGDNTGPSGEGPGTGDNVSANVTYLPWLDDAYPDGDCVGGINQPPVADFSYLPTDPTTADVIQFTDLSYDPDGTVVAWYWDFGDGSDSTDQHPTHQYTVADTYTVCLTVTDDLGLTDEYCEDIVVAEDLVEYLDVEQELYDRGFRMMPGWDAAQEFIPSYQTLSRVELYMTTWNDPAYPIPVEIRKDDPEGDVLFEDLIYPADVTESFPYWGWVSVDVGTISVEVGETYVIVLRSNDDDDDFNHLMWGVYTAFGIPGPYPDGQMLFRKLGFPTWMPIWDFDCTFRTYGLDVFVDQPPEACFTWDCDYPETTEITFDASCSTDDNGIVLYEWDFTDDGVIDYSSDEPFASYDSGDTDAYPVTLTVTDTIGQTDSVAHDVQVQTESELLFEQEWYDGGTAATSTYVEDGDDYIDYEVADNFWDVGHIDKVVAYGLSLMHDGANWVPVTPDAEEPFIVRFYEYEEDFVPGLEAPETGEYYLALQDSFNHWQEGPGSWVSVFVDGDLVIEDATMYPGDPSPKYYTFDADAGDEITTVYIPGDFASENYYAIMTVQDDPDSIIAEEGGTWMDPGQSIPGSISPGGVQPLEPEWANPVSEQEVMADVEWYAEAWGGTYDLYKYEIELDSSVNMEAGWVSVQIDTASGTSGAWFLWMNSLDGDSVAYHRLDTTLEMARDGSAHVTNGDGEDSGGLNTGDVDVLDYDLAFELWG